MEILEGKAGILAIALYQYGYEKGRCDLLYALSSGTDISQEEEPFTDLPIIRCADEMESTLGQNLATTRSFIPADCPSLLTYHPYLDNHSPLYLYPVIAAAKEGEEKKLDYRINFIMSITAELTRLADADEKKEKDSRNMLRLPVSEFNSRHMRALSLAIRKDEPVYVTNAWWCAVTGCAQTVAFRDIRQLSEMGIIRRDENEIGKNSRYLLDKERLLSHVLPLDEGKEAIWNERTAKEFSDAIKSYLESHHITQKEFVAKVGITEATLSRYLSGQRAPSREIYLCIMKSIGK